MHANKATLFVVLHFCMHWAASTAAQGGTSVSKLSSFRHASRTFSSPIIKTTLVPANPQSPSKTTTPMTKHSTSATRSSSSSSSSSSVGFTTTVHSNTTSKTISTSDHSSSTIASNTLSPTTKSSLSQVSSSGIPTITTTSTSTHAVTTTPITSGSTFVSDTKSSISLTSSSTTSTTNSSIASLTTTLSPPARSTSTTASASNSNIRSTYKSSASISSFISTTTIPSITPPVITTASSTTTAFVNSPPPICSPETRIQVRLRQSMGTVQYLSHQAGASFDYLYEAPLQGARVYNYCNNQLLSTDPDVNGNYPAITLLDLDLTVGEATGTTTVSVAADKNGILTFRSVSGDTILSLSESEARIYLFSDVPPSAVRLTPRVVLLD